MITSNNDDSAADALDQYIGNHRLLRLLGRGGFASIYLGEHRYLKRLSAVKVLSTVLNEQDKERFLKEARLLAKLSHPHIVRVHEFEVVQRVKGLGDGKFTEYTPYLVMDFAPGGNLRGLYPTGSCLFVGAAVAYIKQIAAALQYAHDNGIIHRDVKPENCLLNERQEVMLSDFGLALFAPTPELLSTQQMAGTMPYTAPEQLRGKPNFASDQYSLAVMAYEWLCGHRPFEGEGLEIVMQHLASPPPGLRSQNPGISQAVEEVVLKALEKDPQRRYPGVQEFANALEQASQRRSSDLCPYSQASMQASFPAHWQEDAIAESFPSDLRKTKGPQNEHETYALPIGQEQTAKVSRLQRQQQKLLPFSPERKKKRIFIIRILAFVLVLASSGALYFTILTASPALSVKARPNVMEIPTTVLSPILGIADFTVRPSSVHGLTLVTDETSFEGDHSALGAGEQVVADFMLPGSPDPGKAKQISIFMQALVARSGINVGYAPLDVYCNGQIIVQDFTVPGNGFRPNETSFQVPPGLLVKGKNELKLLVSSHALGEFWLYRMGVGMTLTSTPDMADFTVRPASIRGLTLVADETTFLGDHSILDVGQQVVASFTLPGSPGPGKSKQASIFIRALVARLRDTTAGYAPLDVYCNGQIVVQDFSIPDNGFQPEETSFQIPPGLLVYGKNEVTLLVSANVQSKVWLYSMGVMPGIPY